MSSVAATTTTAPRHAHARALLPSPAARAAGLAAAAALLLLAAASSIALGSLPIPLHEVLTALTHPDGGDAHTVVNELRVPRTLLGLLVGSALGAAGALMQGVTRNPLAEPGILGINAGAALAVVLAIRVLGVDAVSGYTAFALAGAALSALAVHLLGTAGAGRSGATPARLALAGAVLAALLTALTSAVLVRNAQTLDQFRFWIVGSLAGRDSAVTATVAPVILVGLAMALAAGRSLNTLAFGEEVARSLGQRVRTTQALCALAFVLLAGGAVAAAGPIAFVGLAVPHVARALVGPDHRWVVPYSAVLGATLLLAADVLGRIIARPGELEVGIVTALVGAPFFVWLVRRRRLVAL